MKRKSPHSQDAWSEGSDSFLHWCTFFILCRLDQLSAFVGKTPRSNTVLQLLETLCGFPRPLAAVTGISWSTRGNLPASWPHLFLIKINFVLGRERNKTLSVLDIMAQCFGQQSCRDKISGPQASDGVRSRGLTHAAIATCILQHLWGENFKCTWMLSLRVVTWRDRSLNSTLQGRTMPFDLWAPVRAWS